MTKTLTHDRTVQTALRNIN